MDTSPLSVPISAPTGPLSLSSCWFCEGEVHSVCVCGRAYCGRHQFDGRCLVCALGLNLFEQADETEPISDLLIFSLVAASKDPYVVVPSGLAGARPLPIAGVERVLGALMRMIKSGDESVRHRAAVVLA